MFLTAELLLVTAVFLDPEYHGKVRCERAPQTQSHSSPHMLTVIYSAALQGVMTHALRSFFDNFLFPTMNCHHLRCSAYEGNFASRRVQVSCSTERQRLHCRRAAHKPVADVTR